MRKSHVWLTTLILTPDESRISKNKARYVKLVSLKSVTMKEVKNLENKADDGDDGYATDADKYLDCHLYGAKYYCTNSIANKAQIMFDICQRTDQWRLAKSAVTSKKTTSISSRDERKAGGGNNIKSKAFMIQELPHTNGFCSIECENDTNGFYVDGQNRDPENQLKHCFLRIYDKNRKIELVQDWNEMHWRQSQLKAVWKSNRLAPKLDKSVPYFIVLVEFLFGVFDSEMAKHTTTHYNYMSLMESIGCLLLFKDYHIKCGLRNKNNNKDDNLFEKCNQVLCNKLKKTENKNFNYCDEWKDVCSCVVFFSFFFLCFVQG